MAKEEEAKDEEAAGGGKKKLIIIIVPIVLLLAGAGWFFFLKPKESGVPEPLPHPTPGSVVQLDSITLNLAGGHFLKFGMALQPIAAAHELDGAKALDLAIEQFSQMTIDELSTADGRTKAKEELVARIKLNYLPHGIELADVAAVDDLPDSGDSEDEKHEDEESEHEDEEAEHEDEDAAHDEETAEGAHAEIHLEKLSAADVIKLADSLTVQAEVYDVYFTEFVMQ
jgi:flagellar FliL protein